MSQRLSAQGEAILEVAWREMISRAPQRLAAQLASRDIVAEARTIIRQSLEAGMSDDDTALVVVKRLLVADG